MNRHASQLGNARDTGVSDDLRMASHSASMHYALASGKRLLHRSFSYQSTMTTPNERLRRAREKMFTSAAEAARALGVPEGTYAGHENGHRGFPANRAPTYARRFKVRAEWLLFGIGDEAAPSSNPSTDDLAAMIEAALRELPVGTPLGEFPRLLAPALNARLEQYQDDNE